MSSYYIFKRNISQPIQQIINLITRNHHKTIRKAKGFIQRFIKLTPISKLRYATIVSKENYFSME